MTTLAEKLRAIAKEKASDANFARANYCAGRAGCDELREIRNEPSDYIEWKAADEIERLKSLTTRLRKSRSRLTSPAT